MYFLAGRHDYKTPGVLVEEYLNALEASAGKRMFWFEESAHVPFIEERSAFHSVMIDTILAESGSPGLGFRQILVVGTAAWPKSDDDRPGDSGPG